MTTINIKGKSYPCEMIGKERIINGMNVSDFVDTLTLEEQVELAKKGFKALIDESCEIYPTNN